MGLIDNLKQEKTCKKDEHVSHNKKWQTVCSPWWLLLVWVIGMIVYNLQCLSASTCLYGKSNHQTAWEKKIVWYIVFVNCNQWKMFFYLGQMSNLVWGLIVGTQNYVSRIISNLIVGTQNFVPRIISNLHIALNLNFNKSNLINENFSRCRNWSM